MPKTNPLKGRDLKEGNNKFRNKDILKDPPVTLSLSTHFPCKHIVNSLQINAKQVTTSSTANQCHRNV